MCAWNQPCSVFSKVKVKASYRRCVPSQMKRLGRVTMSGLKTCAYLLRILELMPSLAITRSASGKSASESTSVSNTSFTPSSSQRACRMLSSFLRPMPTKPWPPLRSVRPLNLSSMSSQWLKACWMVAAVAGSHWRMLSIVWSENTTPQPKVS